MSRLQVYSFAFVITCIDDHLLVRPGYKEDVSELVKVTEDMVKEKAKR